ncbi:hypothetical protein [Streptomyces sp. NPDC014622]|uniref:hypothetical protein n=1 Tax=Streptomyces sp. NPDC014622 TaxID=3364874 RepID=UPI0036FBFFC5
MSFTHLAMAFDTSHPDVTSAIIGPRAMEQLDDLIEGAPRVLDDDVLDRIYAIIPPGTEIGPLDVSCAPPPSPSPACADARPTSAQRPEQP